MINLIDLLNLIDTATLMKPSIKISLAFIIGCFGSVAYLGAVYFGFVGNSDKDREILLKYFKNKKGRVSIAKMGVYCFIGGFLAIVFQLLSYGFAPIQAFLAGVGWPMFVYNNISPRQANAGENMKNIQDDIKSSETGLDEDEKDLKIKELMEKLSK